MLAVFIICCGFVFVAMVSCIYEVYCEKMKDKFGLIFSCMFLGFMVIISVIAGYFAFSDGRQDIVEYEYENAKIKEQSYENKKKVEDTCRAYISSYESDRLTYNMFCQSEDNYEKQTANMALLRANRTAVAYNEYILKNSYVWENNIPEDIKESLPYLEKYMGD